METIYFHELPSTQKYLVSAIKSSELTAPICIVAGSQSSGVGSKENSWVGVDGNLFFSFALPLEHLPDDLPRQSICIYLLYIFKECLSELGSHVNLKWPNDLYLGEKKVCGAMTSILKKEIVCGIGLNSHEAPPEYAKMDIKIDHMPLLAYYFERLKNKPSWASIFSKYSVEFSSKRKEFFGVYLAQGQSVELLSDGSLSIDGEKVFGIR